MILSRGGEGVLFTLETPRLILATTPLAVLKTRLERDDVVADVPIAVGKNGQRRAEVWRVHFPPEWPGDALDMLPLWIMQREVAPEREEWGGTMIDRATRVAVGQMSFKGLPDESGAVELGYGVNPSYHSRGYATEMARTLVEWALTQSAVARVTAECLADNKASIRVLEKSHFKQVGRRVDEDGPLLQWERTR
jgi:ribosomal-protein-alanine N-acetyltransferase